MNILERVAKQFNIRLDTNDQWPNGYRTGLWDMLSPGRASSVGEIDFHCVGRLVTYQESNSALKYRCVNPEAMDQLVLFLATLCEQLGSGGCIYDEDLAQSYVTDTNLILRILETKQFPSGGTVGLMIFSDALVAPEKAKELWSPALVRMHKDWVIINVLR